MNLRILATTVLFAIASGATGAGAALAQTVGTGWDCTADGRRFLVAAPKTAPKSKGPEPYTVILNWQAGLKK